MEEGVIEARAARFSDRFVAYLIDTVPFGAGSVATLWLVIGPLGKSPTQELLALIGAGWVTALFAYQVVGNATGATIGKRMLGLRVVARDGGSPGLLRSLIRALVWLIGSTGGCFGFLVALLNRENRTLHDYASGTVVVEAHPKSAGEGAVLFVVGALGAIGLFVFQIFSAWSRPTPHDRAAVAKADQGLAVIGQAQEAFRAKNGTYASTLDELADISGDPEEFRTAMNALFMPNDFKLEAGNKRWRISALARDRARTPVYIEGPSEP